MNIQHKIQIALLAGALSASYGTSTFAEDASAPPQAVSEGNITYISGGVGSDEEDAIKSEASKYDLLISNAKKNGGFTINAHIVIKNSGGQEILDVDNAGPLFYVNLPSGKYVVQATSRGQQKVQSVNISAPKATDVHLIWQ